MVTSKILATLQPFLYTSLFWLTFTYWEEDCVFRCSVKSHQVLCYMFPTVFISKTVIFI